jgi:hypothetical protein
LSDKIVKLNIAELAPPVEKDWSPAGLTRWTGSSFAHGVVVFTFEQAQYVTVEINIPISLICVDIPRSKLCTSLAGAYEFFKEGKT